MNCDAIIHIHVCNWFTHLHKLRDIDNPTFTVLSLNWPYMARPTMRARTLSLKLSFLAHLLDTT